LCENIIEDCRPKRLGKERNTENALGRVPIFTEEAPCVWLVLRSVWIVCPSAL
jgi:hypothetical protein